MGKSRGSKYGYKGGKGRAAGKGPADDDSESEEEQFQQRRPGGQSATVGMLPPSDSEDDEEEGGEAGKAKEAKPKAEPSKPSGQSRTMGQLPPSDSEEGSGDESSGDDGPSAAYLNARPAPRKKEQDDAPDPRQVRKDLERLEMLKAKREADRQARIKAEGWDRFAPVTETNKPPAGHHRPPRDSDEDDD